jgi:hypothetical protein
MTAACPPVPLGAAIRHEWLLDWSTLTVKHGAYGAAPKVVLAAQEDWRRRMEAQPWLFMRLTLRGADILAAAWRTEIGAGPALSAAMRLVRLPVPGQASPERALAARRKLERRGCDTPVLALGNGLWLRLSAQAYNEAAEYEQRAAFVEAFPAEDIV